MKEAIGNAALFNIIIIFVIILVAFFIGSLAYSKAYKAKNRIIEEIEKDESYTFGADSDTTETRINKWLAEIGYRTNYRKINNGDHCPDTTKEFGEVSGVSLVNNSSTYQYCVYRVDTCKDYDKGICGRYYRVITYMYFDIPIIGGLLQLPVRGDTMTFTQINT